MAESLQITPGATVVGASTTADSYAADGGAEESPLSNKAWRARISACKADRRERVMGWAESVDFRRGKPFEDDLDDDRINVNLDWALTKAKHAQLFSKMPTVLLTSENDAFKPSVPSFQKALNNRLKKGRVNSAMNETIVDVVNAAGVAAVIVSYNTLEEMREVPVEDPMAEMLPDPADVDPASMGLEGLDALSGESHIMPDGTEMAGPPMEGSLPAEPAMETIPYVFDKQFIAERFSPSDLLWPLDFTQSDFDAAMWIGRSGKLAWHDGKRQFKLREEDKEQILGSGGDQHGTPLDDNLRQEAGYQKNYEEAMVEFDECFYRRHHFSDDARSFDEIWRIVYVGGLPDPVVHEHWKGQQYTQNGRLVGALKYPIRVLTLTYISDDAIPPSDSAIGRPQVLSIIKGRTQQDKQRDRSLPIRWFDVNRVDVMVQENLTKGTWNGWVPVNGSGEKAVGEVARANYPNDNWQFDSVAKMDLNEQWQIGSNQMGAYATGERSAREAGIIQQNFQTRIAVERARTTDFYISIAETMAGLMALYDDFEVSNLDAIKAVDATWDRTQLSNELVYSIRPDSSVLMDAPTRINQLERALNLTGQSGYVNPKPIIEEIIGLSDIDPTKVIVDPQPQPPPAPQISYRFTGAADLSSPVVMAMLLKENRAPSPEDLQAAIKLLQAAGIGSEIETKEETTEGGATADEFGNQIPNAPQRKTTVTVKRNQPEPGMDPNQPVQPAAGGPQAPPQGPQNPNWGLQPRVAKRTEDIAG